MEPRGLHVTVHTDATGHTMVTDAGQLGDTSPDSADVRDTSALLSGLSGIRRHGSARLGPVF